MWPPASTCRRSIGIAAAGLVAGGLVRKRMLRWGASDDELRLSLPGDELLATTNVVATRAVTIAATPAEVWPWIAQLGQGRGGFYTYDRLENLVGAGIHSADSIVPEWQHLQAGDDVKLAPEVALTAAQVEPERALVLQGAVQMGKTAAPYDFTWAFVLSELPHGATRLLVRERYTYRRRWAALIVEPTGVISFVMTQRMLRGIRDRAERSSRASDAMIAVPPQRNGPT